VVNKGGKRKGEGGGEILSTLEKKKKKKRPNFLLSCEGGKKGPTSVDTEPRGGKEKGEGIIFCSQFLHKKERKKKREGEATVHLLITAKRGERWIQLRRKGRGGGNATFSLFPWKRKKKKKGFYL